MIEHAFIALCADQLSPFCEVFDALSASGANNCRKARHTPLLHGKSAVHLVVDLPFVRNVCSVLLALIGTSQYEWV